MYSLLRNRQIRDRRFVFFAVVTLVACGMPVHQAVRTAENRRVRGMLPQITDWRGARVREERRWGAPLHRPRLNPLKNHLTKEPAEAMRGGFSLMRFPVGTKGASDACS